MASRRLPVRVRPAPPTTFIHSLRRRRRTRRRPHTKKDLTRHEQASSVSNADEDYIRNYNGPKVATVGRPI